ncbi:MAG: His-Xaa-Ser system radical SAM maturase HxsB, partial [Leptospirales bacterium]
MNTSRDREIQYVIATNLSYLDDEILEFCLKHDIYLSTSLDGPADLNNRNRPRPDHNGFSLTVNQLQKAQRILGKDKISALMTTTEASLGRVKEIIDVYLALGFEGIFLRPVSPYGFAIKTREAGKYDNERWLTFYKEGLDYILSINRTGYFFVEFYTALFLTKLFSPFGSGYVDLQSPAGIGISAIVYNYDGDVYASDEARMLAEMGDKTFRLGNLHKDSYEKMMLSDVLLDTLDQSIAESCPQCSECGFLSYCGSDPVYHHATQGDVIGHKAFSAFCARHMGMLKHLILLLEKDHEVRDLMMRWIQP